MLTGVFLQFLSTVRDCVAGFFHRVSGDMSRFPGDMPGVIRDTVRCRAPGERKDAEEACGCDDEQECFHIAVLLVFGMKPLIGSSKRRTGQSGYIWLHKKGASNQPDEPFHLLAIELNARIK